MVEKEPKIGRIAPFQTTLILCCSLGWADTENDEAYDQTGQYPSH